MKSNQGIAIAALLAVGAVLAVVVARVDPGPVRIAFWFEEISADARVSVHDRLATPITGDEMRTIERLSKDEVAAAFETFPVELRDNGSATYRVRVVDSLRRPFPASGQSHVIAGLGGQGFVDFRLLAHGAAAYAPDAATREDIIAAIGRGIGRAAVHEFAHQILGGGARIDDRRDRGTYEYRSADRVEQYYGAIRWGIAEPLLRERLAGRAR